MKIDKYRTFDIHVPKSIELADIKQALENDERFTNGTVLIPAHEKYDMNQSLNGLRGFIIDPRSIIGVFERVDFKNDHAELCVKMIDTFTNAELIKSMNGKCCKAYPRFIGHRKGDESIEIRKIITFDIVYE